METGLFCYEKYLYKGIENLKRVQKVTGSGSRYITLEQDVPDGLLLIGNAVPGGGQATLKNVSIYVTSNPSAGYLEYMESYRGIGGTSGTSCALYRLHDLKQNDILYVSWTTDYTVEAMYSIFTLQF